MLKLELQDFLEEVKAEMAGYEEIEDSAIIKWEENFKKWMTDKNSKKNRIKHKANSTFIEIKDESEIFKIVDHYLAAIVNDELDKYWIDWQL